MSDCPGLTCTRCSEPCAALADAFAAYQQEIWDTYRRPLEEAEQARKEQQRQRRLAKRAAKDALARRDAFLAPTEPFTVAVSEPPEEGEPAGLTPEQAKSVRYWRRRRRRLPRPAWYHSEVTVGPIVYIARSGADSEPPLVVAQRIGHSTVNDDRQAVALGYTRRPVRGEW